MSLGAQLDEIRNGAMKKIPADKLAVMNGATAALRASGILDGVIKVGSALPPFTLTNMRGATVTSGDLLQRGAVVQVIRNGNERGVWQWRKMCVMPVYHQPIHQLLKGDGNVTLYAKHILGSTLGIGMHTVTR